MIESWSDGNPYFMSDDGKPQFFHHPQEYLLDEYVTQSEGRTLSGKEREKFIASRVGNMSDMLCLDCGAKFQLDLERKEAVCPRKKCHSKNISDTWKLAGKKCPSCKVGRFKSEGLCGVS